MLVYPINKNFIVCEGLKVIFTWSLVLVLFMFLPVRVDLSVGPSIQQPMM